MGKAAKRKAENRKSRGNTSIAPTRVPKEYLPTGDKASPCFGYVYTCHFQDFEPCVFTSHVDDIFTTKQMAVFEMVNLGCVTIIFHKEIDYFAFKELMFLRQKSSSPYISFIAKPDYSLKYTDYNKLSVLPFVYDSCLEVSLSETDLRSFYSGGSLKQPKRFKQLTVNDPNGVEPPVRFVFAETDEERDRLLDALEKSLLRREN